MQYEGVLLTPRPPWVTFNHGHPEDFIKGEVQTWDPGREVGKTDGYIFLSTFRFPREGGGGGQSFKNTPDCINFSEQGVICPPPPCLDVRTTRV